MVAKSVDQPKTDGANIATLINVINVLQCQIQDLTREVLCLINKQSESLESVENHSSRPSTDQSTPPVTYAETVKSGLINNLDNDGVISQQPTQQEPTQISKPPTGNYAARKITPSSQIPVIINNRASETPNEDKNTLIIGSSMIKGVNIKGLKKGSLTHAKGGAGIESITEEIKLFDLRKFSNIIVYIGGNDAAAGMNIETFESKYNQLIQYIKLKNPHCDILLCELCPRYDVDVRDFNNVIYQVALDNGSVLVELFGKFMKHGRVVERYYANDRIHLSISGIKRMLGGINELHHLVDDFKKCTFYQRGRTLHQTNSYTERDSASWRQISRQTTPRGFQYVPRSSRQERSPTGVKHNAVDMCIYCKKTNQASNECYFRKKFNGHCFNCGEIGHKKLNCVNQLG